MACAGKVTIGHIGFLGDARVSLGVFIRAGILISKEKQEGYY